jgi:hypothetical protein
MRVTLGSHIRHNLKFCRLITSQSIIVIAKHVCCSAGQSTLCKIGSRFPARRVENASVYSSFYIYLLILLLLLYLNLNSLSYSICFIGVAMMISIFCSRLFVLICD